MTKNFGLHTSLFSIVLLGLAHPGLSAPKRADPLPIAGTSSTKPTTNVNPTASVERMAIFIAQVGNHLFRIRAVEGIIEELAGIQNEQLKLGKLSEHKQLKFILVLIYKSAYASAKADSIQPTATATREETANVLIEKALKDIEATQTTRLAMAEQKPLVIPSSSLEALKNLQTELTAQLQNPQVKDVRAALNSDANVVSQLTIEAQAKLESIRLEDGKQAYSREEATEAVALGIEKIKASLETPK